MLKLTDVYSGYDNVDIIKKITFTVNKGENLSIIGPNGCGKTTLLKTVAGLLSFRGDIQISGVSVKKMKQSDIASKIGVLTQLSAVYFPYSVYETVMMGRYVHIKDKALGTPSARDKEYVLHCLETVDLLDIKDNDITKLSGGQLQRVFLARVLAQQPDIILLDEPTNHLDLKYQIELTEYLKKWSAQGKFTVMGVLHDINLAMHLSDNIIVMKDGEVIAHGKIAETITPEILEKAYGVNVVQHMLQSLKRWENISG